MALKQKIKQIYQKSRQRYGSPRIYQQLLREGYHIGKKRVESVNFNRKVHHISLQKCTTNCKKIINLNHLFPPPVLPTTLWSP